MAGKKCAWKFGLSNADTAACSLRSAPDVSCLEIPHTNADVVTLASDIAWPKEAVIWASGLSQPVLYVIHGHEFYGGHIDGTAQELR